MNVDVLVVSFTSVASAGACKRNRVAGLTELVAAQMTTPYVPGGTDGGMPACANVVPLATSCCSKTVLPDPYTRTSGPGCWCGSVNHWTARCVSTFQT